MANYSEGSIVSNDKGDKLILHAGQWVPIPAQAQADVSPEVAAGNPGPVQNLQDLGVGAVAGAQSAARSMAGEQMDFSPISMIAKTARAAGDYLGVPKVEAPGNIAGLVGEIAGGVLAGGLPGLGAAGSRLVHPAARALGIAEKIVPEAGAGVGAEGMIQRAMGSVKEAYDITRGKIPAAGENRVLQGMMTADELKAQGVPLARSQEAMLNAGTGQDILHAQKLRWAEDMKGGTPEILQAQKQAFTNTVKGELGVVGEQNLTPSVVSDVLAKEGQTIGAIVKAKGPVNLGQDGLDKIAEVVKNADTTHAGALRNVQKDLQASMARNGGAVDPVDFQRNLTRLNKMATPGGDAGKIADAHEVLDVLHESLAKELSGAELQALKDARYRYKIAKTLDSSGAVDPLGHVNPASFGGKWDKRIGQTLRGKDKLGRAADTYKALLNPQAHTGSTLTRIMLNAPQTATQAALTAAGVGGLGALLR